MQASLSEIILGMCFFETVTFLYNSSFFYSNFVFVNSI